MPVVELHVHDPSQHSSTGPVRAVSLDTGSTLPPVHEDRPAEDPENAPFFKQRWPEHYDSEQPVPAILS